MAEIHFSYLLQKANKILVLLGGGHLCFMRCCIGRPTQLPMALIMIQNTILDFKISSEVRDQL